MDTPAKLTQTVLLLILLTFSTSSQASLAAAASYEVASWIGSLGEIFAKPEAGKDEATRTTDGQGNRTVNVKSSVDYRATNGKTYNIPVEKTAQIDGSKIGKAVVKLAKFSTPLFLGIAAYELVCELSNICKSENDDTWIYSEPETQPSKNTTGWCDPRTNTLEDCLHQYNCGYEEFWGPINGLCNSFEVINNGESIRFLRHISCIGCQVQAGQFNRLPGDAYVSSSDSRPITETDWTAAETALNHPDFDQVLLDKGAAVPVSGVPGLVDYPPIPIGSTTTVNKDAQGNVTGTTTSNTSIVVSNDGATTERPGRVTITEIQTLTQTDTQGQTISTTTTQTQAPPADKPMEITIDFDSVSDGDLEEQEPDIELENAESWGSGECPADVDVGIYNLVLKMQPACTFAEGVRPVVILIAMISGLFIISGVRTDS